MKGNVQLMRTINFIIVIIYLPIIAFFLWLWVSIHVRKRTLVRKITLNQGHIRELNHESLLKIGFKEREPKPIIKEEDKYDEDGLQSIDHKIDTFGYSALSGNNYDEDGNICNPDILPNINEL
jgi:hypothetical protein